ncbi:hypothetical protein [Microbacterium sp. NPDC087589]|uniref:hypothetical protein n=1 Tax=Microbacterium sp. NPDC087589 TaxID=3364191 RepID=UPI00380689BC
MSDSVVPINAVFDALARTARTRASEERPFFGAQAKLELIRELGHFTESSYGYKKFIDLLKAGRDSGRFELELVDGHTRILPAGAAPTAIPVSAPSRIQHDLWTTIVSWDVGSRFWDRKRNRAIFVPTDAAGNPLWETEPDSFVPIEPIPMETQLEWMDEFAREQNDEARDRLLEALAGSLAGAFKRALGELGLAPAWRSRLRHRVIEHATSWASLHSLTPSSILEQPAKRKTVTDTQATAPAAPPVPSAGGNSVATGAEALRARLHKVIDQMSPAELMALSIPAAYLLES